MDGQQKIVVGGKELQFILTVSTDKKLYAWATAVDESWITVTSGLLYKTIEDHPIMCATKNTIDSKDFATTMKFDDFKTVGLDSEAGRFRDYVLSLCYSTTEKISKTKNVSVYVSFFSSTTSSVVHAMVEFGTGTITFGATVNG